MKILNTLNLGVGIDQGASSIRELTSEELAFVAGGEGGGSSGGGSGGEGGGGSSGGGGGCGGEGC